MRDWRKPIGYGTSATRPAAIAWGYLRRSPAYRQAFARGTDAAARFGIAGMRDPASDTLPRFLRTSRAVRVTATSPAARGIGTVVVFQFDVTLPRQEQLDSIARACSRWAAAYGEHRPRLPSVPRLILGHRALDACEAGASIAEIATTFFLRRDEDCRGTRARELARRQALCLVAMAERFRDGDYLRIAEHATDLDDDIRGEAPPLESVRCGISAPAKMETSLKEARS